MQKKYKKLLLNVRCNPLKKAKKVKFQVNIENEKQLRERIEKLEGKIKIKDNTEKKYWYYDTVVDGQRYKTMARYVDEPKEEALEQISVKKQELIKKLTIYFE